jgi:hypothetical protein
MRPFPERNIPQQESYNSTIDATVADYKIQHTQQSLAEALERYCTRLNKIFHL